MSPDNFQYAVGAVLFPPQQEEFNKMRDELLAATRPGNFVEQLVVDQLLHAQWELHRVRTLSDNAAAEDSLHAAAARANRNWLRASRELAALQTGRIAADLCVTAGEPDPPPCANMAKVPKRRPMKAATSAWYCNLMEGGYRSPASLLDPEKNQQEAA